MRIALVWMLCCLSLVSCSSPPSQPASLWDSLPSAEADAVKSIPSREWTREPPSDSSSAVGETPQSQELKGTLVINEVFYDSKDSDTDGHLFVELYGTPGMAIGGCKIHFVNGSDGAVDDTITLPDGAVVRQDGLFLIADAKTGSTTESSVAAPDDIDNFDPQNGPDALQLVDAQERLLDAVGYGSEIQMTAQNGLAAFEGTPAQDVITGHSLERKVPGGDSQDNSADFMDQDIPTPGALPAATEPTPDPTPDPQPQPDPDPNPNSQPVPQPNPAPIVVLNEIYYDAVGSDTDGLLFIELFGTPGAEISGDRINFVNGDDGKIYDFILLPQAESLPDDGYFVIADARNGSTTETRVLNADFIDSFDPQNGPDAVQLLDSSGHLLDAVGYGAALASQAENGLATFLGTPTMDVINGHSLERREAGVDTFDNFGDFVDREVPTPGR